MAIQAIGAQPQMILPTAQQVREDTDSQSAQAGSIQVTPEVEDSSTRDYGAEYGSASTGDEQARLAQFLAMFEDNVTEQIASAREENEISEDLSDEDVDTALANFKVDVQSIREKSAESEDSALDVSFISGGVMDAMSKLASSLRFSIEGILPSVPPQPFEAHFPPEQETPEPGAVLFDEIVNQGLDELA